ncbi:MAG TPA: prepilin-type N-terminal cleavage/methylation domain-containing protein [Methylococcaceae bacterium]|nr:prepilin-type N-terminal cleavage/methylation domain-containing protein [Methylococcaceae bacterium]
MTNQQGFTLIESLVSVAFIAIGFVGVFGLVNVSNDMLHNSIEREHLNDQANAIIETLSADISGIETYKGKNLAHCGALKPTPGKKEETQFTRMKKWCEKIQGRLGPAQAGDKRIIHVEYIKEENVYVVAVELTSRDGKNSSWVKRVFNAPP